MWQDTKKIHHLLFYNALLFTLVTSISLPKVEILVWNSEDLREANFGGFLYKDYHPEPNYLGHAVNKTEWKCPVDCIYTGDRTRVSEVDAVLFEGVAIAGKGNGYRRNPPSIPHKFPGQMWVDTGYETAHYSGLVGDPAFLELMDAHMTYDQDADVPQTFTCMWGGGNLTDLLKMPPKKAKDKCIVWMTSNCMFGGASERSIYMEELMKYVDIDSFGKCLHTKDLPAEMQRPIYDDHGASMRNKIAIFSDYKFVISFENNNVTDYVSEKMMTAFQAGSVPIYMGSRNVHPDWTPGENSIINVDDFSGPMELGLHLKKLCDDDDAYMKLLEWKKIGFSDQFLEKFRNCLFYGAECRLCQHIHNQRHRHHRMEPSNGADVTDADEEMDADLDVDDVDIDVDASDIGASDIDASDIDVDIDGLDVDVSDIDASDVDIEASDVDQSDVSDGSIPSTSPSPIPNPSASHPDATSYAHHAVLFDGVSYISMERDFPAFSNFTVMMWITHLGKEISSLMSLGNQLQLQLSTCQTCQDRKYLSFCFRQDCYSGTQIIREKLTHVSVTCQFQDEDGILQFFVNGRPDVQLYLSKVQVEFKLKNLLLGGSRGGVMDDFSIWNRVLKESEIRDRMHRVLDVDPDLLTYVSFDVGHISELVDVYGHPLHADGMIALVESFVKPLVTIRSDHETFE
eukprot:TRINITY_DN6702_c0_g1_i2.p1 TRINITY_DN6702_c0_g1~~TRINITY_DN6702_c0_g1_i2.p1  ORF type:complete len:683 (+),score=225.28 TRINITY_DN6702_c0_g1_i2:25-2073(+)